MANIPIPQFPDFRRLHFDDIAWYNTYYKQFPPYADFSFHNLYIWLDQHNDLQVSQLNGNIVFLCTSVFMHDKKMLTFLAKSDIPETVKQLFTFQKQQGYNQELLGVPEFIVEQLRANGTDYRVEDDRDNYEYILNVPLLSRMEGPTIKRIRQYIHVYERDNPTVAVKELDMNDNNSSVFLLGNLLSWEKAFSTNETADQERKVIERTIHHAKQLGYKNVSVFIEDKLVSFALYQLPPQNNTAIVNHLKTSYDYHNSSYYISHVLAQALDKQGLAYMNYEQDLGIEGLRNFKMKLKPDHLLAKYSIYPI